MKPKTKEETVKEFRDLAEMFRRLHEKETS